MKKTICVVEDEKDLNELVKRYLEREGYEVRNYYRYEEALAHVHDEDVHLWVLDIMLDDKKFSGNIVLTGYDFNNDIDISDKLTESIFVKE